MPGTRKAAALALLAATQFLLVLDASIVNVALPSIGRDLHVNPEDLSWVVNAYILLFGGFLLLGGRAADYLGRRRMYITGLVLFSVASLGGALAPSGPWLAVARGVQGLGAALVSPAALALLLTLFDEGAERSKALGVWAALGGSGGAAGAILGGLLTDGFGWQAVLLVNLPVGAVAVAITPRLLPESRTGLDDRRFDLAGAVSVTAGVALLIYAVLDANDAGWRSAQTLVLTTAAVGLLLAFVAVEARSQRPLVPLAIFGRRRLRGANLVTLLNTGALFPMFFFLTLYTQDVLGYSPVEAGLAGLPLAVSIAATATLAPRLVLRVGYKTTLVAGLAVVAAGLGWFAALSPDGSFLDDLLGPSLVVGVGAGAAWVASMASATSGADPAEAGLAAGLVNTAQQLGGALGIAALVAVATGRTTSLLASGQAGRLVALTEGFQAGLTVGALVAVAGAAVATALLSSADSRRHAAAARQARGRGPRVGDGRAAPQPLEEIGGHPS